MHCVPPNNKGEGGGFRDWLLQQQICLLPWVRRSFLSLGIPSSRLRKMATRTTRIDTIVCCSSFGQRTSLSTRISDSASFLPPGSIPVLPSRSTPPAEVHVCVACRSVRDCGRGRKLCAPQERYGWEFRSEGTEKKKTILSWVSPRSLVSEEPHIRRSRNLCSVSTSSSNSKPCFEFCPVSRSRQHV